MVVNASLAAIAKHGGARKSGINVYQTTSSLVNPLVLHDFLRSCYEHFNSMPCLNSNGRPVYVEEFECFNSMDDFSAHLQRDAFKLPGLTTPRKREIMHDKLVQYAEHLAGIYKAYSFYSGR